MSDDYPIHESLDGDYQTITFAGEELRVVNHPNQTRTPEEYRINREANYDTWLSSCLRTDPELTRRMLLPLTTINDGIEAAFWDKSCGVGTSLSKPTKISQPERYEAASILSRNFGLMSAEDKEAFIKAQEKRREGETIQDVIENPFMELDSVEDADKDKPFTAEIAVDRILKFYRYGPEAKKWPLGFITDDLLIEFMSCISDNYHKFGQAIKATGFEQTISEWFNDAAKNIALTYEHNDSTISGESNLLDIKNQFDWDVGTSLLKGTEKSNCRSIKFHFNPSKYELIDTSKERKEYLLSLVTDEKIERLRKRFEDNEGALTPRSGFTTTGRGQNNGEEGFDEELNINVLEDESSQVGEIPEMREEDFSFSGGGAVMEYSMEIQLSDSEHEAFDEENRRSGKRTRLE